MKNMIKRIIAGVIIGLVLMACRKYLFINAHALDYFRQDNTFYINGSKLAGSYYLSPQTTSLRFDLRGESYYDITEIPNYFVLSICSNQNFGAFTLSSGVNNLNIYNTNTQCVYSNGAIGKMRYLIIQPNKSGLLSNYCSVQGTNCSYGCGSSYCYVNFSIATTGLGSYQLLTIDRSDTAPQITDMSADFSSLENAQNATTNAVNNATNAINNNTNATNNMNNSIKDETPPNVQNDLFNGITTDDESNSPVSDLILMPLTLMNAYVDGFSSTCNSFDLGSLYGHNIVLPCIDIEDYLGSNLWGLIDIMFTLFLVYNIGLMCVSMYESITSLEDGFRGLYTPRHADSGYQPRHGGGD